MSEQPTSQQPNPDRPARCPGRGRGRAAFVIVVVALAGALFGALVTTSSSQGLGQSWHGGMMRGPMGPAFSPERADRMVRHLAVELDANADQQAKLQAIVKSAVDDLAPMREKVLAARQQGRALLTAPAVDRAAIENHNVLAALSQLVSRREARNARSYDDRSGPLVLGKARCRRDIDVHPK